MAPENAHDPGYIGYLLMLQIRAPHALIRRFFTALFTGKPESSNIVEEC